MKLLRYRRIRSAKGNRFGLFLARFACACFGILISSVFGAHSVFASERPTDTKMLLLVTNGSQWGPTEDAFSAHAFSLKGSRGRALWHDSEPGKIIMVNPENNTYLKVSIDEYLDAEAHHHGLPKEYTVKNSATKLPDGRAAVASVFTGPDRRGNVGVLQTIVSIPNIVVSPAMAKAWCTIMNSKPELGFPVSLQRANRGHNRRKTAPHDLVVYRSIKFIAVQPQRFEVPKNYKPATDRSAFYFSSNGDLKKADIDDLFGALRK